MDIAEILGYVSALFIGVSLGLIGGGGSILTVPVLVYLLGVNPILATAYSLFIVGISSLFGAYHNFSKGLVNLKTAVIFGLPSIMAVFITRKFIVPDIPEFLVTLGNFELTKNIAVMILFALLMIAASISMIRNKKGKDYDKEETQQVFNYPLILIEGIVVGILTGLVGAGGGFLIIPALVVLSKLPMKMAVGTSLVIIAVKSLIGFTGDISNLEIDWIFLVPFSVISIFGIFLGGYLSNFIAGEKLKPAFGYFVLIMGSYILGKEIFL